MKNAFLTTLAAAAFLIPAAPATANTYDVYSCWAGAGTFRNPNASSAAWAKDQAAAGGHYAPGDDCGRNSASGSMSIVSLTGEFAGQDQYTQWAFDSPAGTTLASARIWRRGWTFGTGTGGSSQRNYLAVLTDGSAFVYDADGGSDIPYGSRGSGDLTNHGVVDSNLLSMNLASRGATSLAYRVGCGFAMGCPTASASAPGPNYFASGVEMFGAVVSITDDALPTMQIGASGLFDGNVASGIRPVAVSSATDASGIKKLAVFVDGGTTPVGVLDFEQDVNRCNWATPAPCQNVADTEIPVDTTQLADGEHAFVVKAYDAADNEKASTTHYVTVKNAAPAPPTEGAGGTTGTGGAGQSGGTDPASGTGSNTGLPNGIDQGTGGGVAAGPTTATPKLLVTFDQNGKSKVTAKYARMITVRGHLTDGSGGPIIDAQVDYSALSTRAGARVQSLGAVRTDSSGTFTLMVATKLGSRQLRFAYSPQIGGAVVTTARAQLDVTAPISLKIGPKHVRNKHSVTFRGRLGAGPIPRKGKLISMQVVVDGRWHTFAVVRSTKRGNFKYRYRFKRTYGRVTYRFRALSRYEAAYPFVAGHSKTARVRVN